MDDGVSSEELGRACSLLATEHATLQSARTSCVLESTGRLTSFLGTVSSVVIALAFIGQVTKFDLTFFLFALTLLPAVAVLGVFTFVRTLQNRIEDSYYARAINRLRHFYVEVAPCALDYISLPIHDNLGSLQIMSVHSSLTAPMTTVAGSVAFVNSLLIGVSAALGAQLAFNWQVFTDTGAGAVFFVLSLALHYFYQRRRWRALQASFESKFPGSTARTSAPRARNARIVSAP